jgi:hypothetical protein
MTIEAVLLHPSKNVSGNLLWPGELPEAEWGALESAIISLRAKGYWASAFPEGDGVTFNSELNEDYNPDRALADFRETFSFLTISMLDKNEGLADTLARFATDRTVMCRYLTPVESIRLDTAIELGETRFHPPVDGYEHRLADHAWQELCDVVGADANPNWAPGAHDSGTTELLAHPLIERTVEVPLALIYAATSSYDAQTPLLRLVLEDADSALDPIRFNACHYRKLHYLPAKPGWIGDTAIVYLMPQTRAADPRLLQGKPYVLRVSNNWLGLQVDEALSGPNPLADIVDSTDTDEITLALKAALRAWNRSFYLVDLEASFLHLVYAIDALCAPGKLSGDRQRLWISAFATGRDAARFATLLDAFDAHYKLRNRIVHEGKTFAALGLAGEEQCQFMLGVLASCIRRFSTEGFASRADARDFAFKRLNEPALASVIDGMVDPNFTLPLAADKDFKKHMDL